jgi:serine/threonine protein kinase
MGTPPVVDPMPILSRHAGLAIVSTVRPGGQKQVWEVTYNGVRYALKLICSAPEAIERARRKIGIMHLCDCPHLVKMGPLDLHDISIGGQPFIYYLEEFIDGTPLDRLTKPMALLDCKTLGLHLASAISALWERRYVHRDIKPSNIMVQSGTREFVLLDTGLALDLTGPSLTRAGGVVGTQLYWCPDQIRLTKRQLDFRTDLYAVGLCMYECLTGVHPLWNPRVDQSDLIDNILNLVPLPLTDYRADIPQRLQEVVLRLLEKEPHLRYSRIAHFVTDLEAVQFP